MQKANFIIVNRDDIPRNLKPGSYTTKVISSGYEGNQFVIRLEYIGEDYNHREPNCLFPLVKHDLDMNSSACLKTSVLDI